ncbi:MAG: MBOAT family protein, partial [Paramuribaculum sp.]|nr:MBOAT family protein [Paramuribaculum sp.]
MDKVTDFFSGFDIDKVWQVLKFDAANPLLFNTGLFLLLFVGFIIIYRILRRCKWLKLIFVILFSLYFYYKSSAEYCFILLGVCISDYILGIFMGKAKWN